MQSETGDSRGRYARVGLFLVVLVVLAGCTGGDTTTTYSASQVAVANGTATDTAYSTAGPQNLTSNVTVVLNNSTHTVVFTNYATHYTKNASFDPGDRAAFATFTVVASPNVSVGNASLNPLGNANHSQVIRTFEGYATGVTVGDRVNRTNVTGLGDERNVSKFEAEIELAGNGSSQNRTVEVYVHVARFDQGDDHVVAVAAYPRSAPDEREAVLEMIRGIERRS